MTLSVGLVWEGYRNASHTVYTALIIVFRTDNSFMHWAGFTEASGEKDARCVVDSLATTKCRATPPGR